MMTELKSKLNYMRCFILAMLCLAMLLGTGQAMQKVLIPLNDADSLATHKANPNTTC